MIEVPVVAEGDLSIEDFTQLAPVTDFFGVGPEIWSADDPVAKMAEIQVAIAAGF